MGRMLFVKQNNKINLIKILQKEESKQENTVQHNIILEYVLEENISFCKVW